MREYDYVPRPKVEDHHHIRDLIAAQEKRAEDREYHRSKEKERQEKDRLISDAKMQEVVDFWCATCGKEFRAQSVLEVETDWNDPKERIAFYRSKCFEGHRCIRHLTDRWQDPYWFRSKAVAIDRGKHFADILQPWEIGYDMLYSNKNKG